MIKYVEYIPDGSLSLYISAYWRLETGPLYQPVNRQIFADGCAEIFINIGESTPGVNKENVLKPGKVYFGGTMTGSSQVNSIPNSRFVGIRFKPSGFAAFYDMAMNEFVDAIVEFPDQELYTLVELEEGLADRLNVYFLRKLKSKKHEMILDMTRTIEQLKGMATVDHIARTHNVSNRTLERAFTKNIGIPPKEYIKIIRFQHAVKRLQARRKPNDLLGIAIDMGYYDHAHFTREIKKYSGLTPSELITLP
jgi:AraC-like DNA-binding protein